FILQSIWDWYSKSPTIQNDIPNQISHQNQQQQQNSYPTNTFSNENSGYLTDADQNQLLDSKQIQRSTNYHHQYYQQQSSIYSETSNHPSLSSSTESNSSNSASDSSISTTTLSIPPYYQRLQLYQHYRQRRYPSTNLNNNRISYFSNE